MRWDATKIPLLAAPVTEKAGRTSIAIPFHNNLTLEEVEYVAQVLEEGTGTAEHTSSMKSRVQSILIFMLIVTLAFIWGNSIGSGPESHSDSKKVFEYVKPILEPVVGAGNVTDHLVRKFAHFAEFGVLGCELAALLVVRRRVGLQGVANCLFAGLSVAVIDETIQIFSNRGSQVQDVLLDFAGVCAGVACALLIRWLVSAVRRKWSERPRC